MTMVVQVGKMKAVRHKGDLVTEVGYICGRSSRKGLGFGRIDNEGKIGWRVEL